MPTYLQPKPNRCMYTVTQPENVTFSDSGIKNILAKTGVLI